MTVEEVKNTINIHKKILNIHKKRVMIAVISDNIHTLANSEISHMEWFIRKGWIKDEADTRFNEIIRGYIDSTGVYLYKADFTTDDELENWVISNRERINDIAEKIVKTGTKVYCGLIKGKLGEKYPPDKFMYEIKGKGV